MRPSSSARIAGFAAVTILAATFTIPTANAAGNPPEYTWGNPSTVATSASSLEVVASDSTGALAVTAALRQTSSGKVINVYYARGDGAWTLDTTIATTVGSDPGRPDIATDGRGWALTWQRPNISGKYDTLVALKSVAGSTAVVIPTIESSWPSLLPAQPSIDGVENLSDFGGLRYSLAMIEARDIVTDSHVVTRDFRDEHWANTVHHDRNDETGTAIVSDPLIKASTNGVSAVGFELATNGSATLQVITRSATDQGFAWSRPIAAGSGLANATVSGPWDLDVADRAASFVDTAWTRRIGDASTMVYARTTTFFGSVLRLAGAASGSAITDLQVSSSKTTNSAVTWVEQADSSLTEPQRYKIRSLAINAATGAIRLADLESGDVLGLPQMSTDMGSEGDLWVAVQRRGSDFRTRVGVLHSINVVTDAVWADKTVTSVSPDESVRALGVAMLATSDPTVQPRVLWNDLASSSTTYRIRSNQREVVPQIPPDPPTSVVATPEDSSATVTWTAPADPGSDPITGYTATANPGGRTCQTAGTLTCTVAGLTNGTAYTFTVIATNRQGNSDPSAPSAPVTPTADARVPDAPTDVAAVGLDAGASVSWIAPADSGSSPITGYTATANPGGRTCQSAGALTCTVDGLTNGTAYTFTVTAVNAAGASAESVPSNPATPSAQAVPPSPPREVTATAGDAEATVTWTPPADAGSSPITGYRVISIPAGTVCDTDASTLECRLRGLSNSTEYTFAVTALSAVGASTAAMSNPVTPTAAPVVRPTAPESVTVKAKKKGKVVIRWTASPSPNISGYILGIKKGTGAWKKKDVGDVLTKTYKKVKAGKKACYRVAAVNDAGTKSVWTAKTCVVAKP